MDPEVSKLLATVTSLGETVKKHAITDNDNSASRESRRELLSATRQLTNELQNEGQIVEGYLYGTIDPLLIKMGIDLGIFRTLVDSSSPVTLGELVAASGADEVLLARIMRGLSSIHAVNEAGIERYEPNKVTRAFTTVKGESGMDVFHNINHPGWQSLPQCLRATDYRNPTDPAQMWFGRQFNGEPYFDWLGKRPELLHSFHQFMSTQRDGHAHWLEFYPIQQQLLPGFDAGDPNAVFMVDVGGSVGHEIQEVKRRYPDIPGRMVLQDVPATIARVIPENGMEAMAHDFFTPNSIKGARAYYLRNVLHDWDDDRCRVILNHIRDAMTPGYSVLLINEFSIPLKGACSFATHSDFMLMAINAAVERTEQQWYHLMQSVGLQIKQIWSLEPDTESLLEVTRGD
ncbi:S-adenosyl-L-methionine-dependent methyltransferase [Aspergillus campestris IBT 28561]|uniref:S-adenosyl-L-methionine-dependent methyltransferase n=1 Tax=Aspergillus campestris (strain IBT 28561) TaxID=1392248 RepID=A0A2I1DDE1_ASPC2|nr:S-adenosyl-L-methionine-dependent methyltransferase [Aspergillus campestris IBT 28561]PKY07885.1 S-adenosyl-L-methionine-dependent methyltransferase [Aspergillus campestris IBT 28561]